MPHTSTSRAACRQAFGEAAAMPMAVPGDDLLCVQGHRELGMQAQLDRLGDVSVGPAGCWLLSHRYVANAHRITRPNTGAWLERTCLVDRARLSSPPTSRRRWPPVRRVRRGAAARTASRRFDCCRLENIAPVDLAQSAIGPGIAIFSRYAKVVEADGTSHDRAFSALV